MTPTLAEQIDVELSRAWYAKRSPALNALYEARREEWQRRNTRISAHLGNFVYVIFFVADIILIHDVALASIIARFVIGAAFLSCTEVLFRRGARSLIIETECAAATVVAFATWLLIASCSQNRDVLPYYVTYGVIFMLGQNVFFNFRFFVAAVSSTSILLFSQITLLHEFYLSVQYLFVVSTLYFSTYALTLFVNWKLNDERYLVILNSVRAEIRQEEAIERGEALLRLSSTDALTSLANRRAIDDQLRVFWQAWQTSQRSFAVVLIDVDFFKRYNDCYGHQKGDTCLVAVAKAMVKAVEGEHCVLGRFGGEEFILLVPATSRKNIAAIAESVRHSVEDLQIPHEQRPDQSHVVTVSIGAALSDDIPGSKFERLVTEADRALYNAKNGNRNCVRIFDRNDPNQLDVNENIADLLRTAESRNLVSLVYQPIRDRSGRVVAVEALMRLRTPSGKSISPAVFIPLAEQMGLIVQLGRWAIRTACRELLVGQLVPAVSVNVSALQLRSPGFPLSVAAILTEFGVAPQRLIIEVTEGLQIEGQPEIVQSIQELRLLGVRIWLDDFGTGFAGLSCVREVEFDAVKIDRSFLQASSTPKGAEMLRGIVDLVRGTGSQVLMEGVETQEQRDILLGLQVDLLQGFYLGRPAAAADMMPAIAHVANAAFLERSLSA
ncbi:putative bifunctional diguanylate cyclase/phosphodiesterase [Methylobacterium segetis]|uniref:putative bifunctional diguanylate cyclase/phosphodiesterase n=1 Tax=Methylobacterium segetis TaxID=2488750 RepID=UPI00104B09C9|nr:bifunctional diguanylate cyclase/phosphodiesterase [Methylobacterium segetis]